MVKGVCFWTAWAAGDPQPGRDSPEGLWPWATQAEVGTPLRDCSPWVTHTEEKNKEQRKINKQ